MIGDIIREVGGVVNKLVPDSDLRTRLQHELDTQEFQARIKQIEVNAEAAKKGSFFHTGARAFIIWACGFVVVTPMLVPYIGWMIQTACRLFGIEFELPPLPEVDPAFAFYALTGLLGLGGARSWEKSRGIARR